MRTDKFLNIFGDNGEIFGFSTPISSRMIASAGQINPALRDEIMQRSEQEPGVKISNVGGWQSRSNLTSWTLPEVNRLQEEIQAGVIRMMELAVKDKFACGVHVTAWANINQAGNFNKPHRHGGHHWSGVYYVSIPESPAEGIGGQLEIRDPRPAAGIVDVPGFPMGNSLKVNPREGLMVIFPSWIDHQVLPFEGDGARISIAFNCMLTNFQIRN